MDSFLETFWNLDQIFGWAEKRDPEVVRAASLPRYAASKKTVEIMIPVTHSATALLRDRRDIDGELWTSSGWLPRQREFVPWEELHERAEARGVPAFQLYRYRDLQIHWPLDPLARALAHGWKFALESDRVLAVEITLDHFEDKTGILDDPRISRLAPALATLLRARASAPEVRGPPNVFFREPFPTLSFLKHLFDSGRLHAFGNRPDNPQAVPMSTADWGGLEIGVGGDQERLGVWMRGRIKTSGRGDFENVRVARDEILREFPIALPHAEDLPPPVLTDDEILEVIKVASDQRGGFISQKAGAKLVQQRFPEVPRDRARKLVKQVTRSDKPGPKGPRVRKSANPAI